MSADSDEGNSSAVSRFINHYKLLGRTDAVLQQERRQRLLETQQRSREQALDDGRPGLLEELEADEEYADDSMECQQTPQRQRRQVRRFKSKLFARKIQLSEWMHERPDDLENWLVRPCPVGQRCLLVFRKKHAFAFCKRGHSIAHIKTKLHHNRFAMVLDCILAKNRTFYILDALVMAKVDLVHCDCQFRFAWIESKFRENNHAELFNDSHSKAKEPFRLSLLPSYDISSEDAMVDCWSRYPAFTDDTPQLDGFLFYHKASTYVHGTTPLVLWLFPFMLKDVLKLPPGIVNGLFTAKRPASYNGNYTEYIEEFNRRQAERKRKRNRRKPKQKMDTSDGAMDHVPDAALWEAMEGVPLDSDDEDLRPREADAMRELELEQ